MTESKPAPFYHRWIIGALVKRRGTEFTHEWMINSTPYPFGQPYWYEYVEAAWMAILPMWTYRLAWRWLFHHCDCCGCWMSLHRRSDFMGLCLRCDKRMAEDRCAEGAAS